ncbi:SUZ domain-containing protein 1 [Tyrophagus putrescentiae]|nr:SUZ domain-containing protein 1 [Tyrophagus putrescentiae]
MTDSVCDSWEDVDVDNIVLKPSAKKNTPSSSHSIIINRSGGGGNIELHNRGERRQHRGAHHHDNRQLNYAQACRPSLLPTPPSTATISAPPTTSFTSPFEDQHRPRVTLEDDTRTQFVPRLRILNRPNASDRSDQDGKDALLRTAEERNRALLKSFEEKRAEYAKARLRILGEEMPQEEVVAAAASPFNLSEMKEALLDGQNTSSTSNNSNTSTTTSTPLLPTPSSQPLSAVNNAGSANVLRQPTAPDGTRGFHHHHHRARS